MTVGPWKPIKLETFSTRITDVDVRVNIREDLYANVDVNFTLSSEALSGPVVIASVAIKTPSGDLVIGRPHGPIAAGGTASMNFGMSKGAYDLWWPIGYGEQPLYTVEIAVADEVRFSPGARS